MLRGKAPIIALVLVFVVGVAYQYVRTAGSRQLMAAEYASRYPDAFGHQIVVAYVNPGCPSCATCISQIATVATTKAIVHFVIVGQGESALRAGVLLEAVQSLNGLSGAVDRILLAAGSTDAIAYYETHPEVLGITRHQLSETANVAEVRARSNLEIAKRLGIRSYPAIYVDGRYRYDGCSPGFLSTLR
jgi:hypothetical protein